MPHITSEVDFRPKWYLCHGHLETIIPSLYRKTQSIDCQRKRLELNDGDFLDLDWWYGNHRRLVVLTHGLEGSSRRPYMTEMARHLLTKGWDILAWNCRSCSGEMNRLPRLYSHADTEDISTIVNYADAKKQYDKIALVGFSMGGAITMNYLGRRSNEVPKSVVTAIGFSMPTCLSSSVKRLEERGNFLYKRKFMRQLSAKIRAKAASFPDIIDAANLDKIKQWRDFDAFYAAPMNKFDSPEAFYHAASAVHVLNDIKIPFLICNSQNDPLLTPECSPIDLAQASVLFHLETPRFGGHVGYWPFRNDIAWSEYRAAQWLSTYI